MSHGPAPKLFATNVTIKTSYFNLTNAALFTSRYHTDDVMALAYRTDDGESGILSVNLAQYGRFPQPGCVFVRGYGEFEGVATALVEAGLAKIVTSVPIGFGSGYEIELIGQEGSEGSAV